MSDPKPWEKYQSTGPWSKYKPQQQASATSAPIAATKNVVGIGRPPENDDLSDGTYVVSAGVPGGGVSSSGYINAPVGSWRARKADELRTNEKPVDVFHAVTGFARNALSDTLMNPAQAAEDYSPAGSAKSFMANSERAGGEIRRGNLSGAGAAYGDVLSDAAWTALDFAGIKGGRVFGKNALSGMGGDILEDTAQAPSRLAKGAIEKTPSLDAIRLARDNAYKSLDDSGVRYTGEGYTSLVDRIQRKLAAELDSVFHPNSTNALKVMKDRQGREMTFSELDKLRQYIRDNVTAPSPSAKPDDIRLGREIIDEIDDFIAKADPKNISSGNAQQAAETIKNARLLHSQAKKTELIEDAFAEARQNASVAGSGGNVENQMRQSINRILKSPKKLRGFTPDEIDEMVKFTRGGTAQNFLRWYGKMSPTSGGLMASIGIQGAALNPLTAPLFIGAVGAKELAKRGTFRQANKLSDRIRRNALSAL